MSMSLTQRDSVLVREIGNGIHIEKARCKYDRRHKMLAVVHTLPTGAPQIVCEFGLRFEEEARWYAQGYMSAILQLGLVKAR